MNYGTMANLLLEQFTTSFNGVNKLSAELSVAHRSNGIITLICKHAITPPEIVQKLYQHVGHDRSFQRCNATLMRRSTNYIAEQCMQLSYIKLGEDKSCDIFPVFGR